MTLERAYCEAVYTAALPDGEQVLMVGMGCPALDRLLMARGVTRAARLTAANPGSTQRLPDAVNAAANAKLAVELDRLACARFPCRSAGPNGEWPEDGFLALGLTRPHAEALGRAYGQRGILWIEAGRPVELVML